MKVIPINNNYKTYNTQTYKTVPVKQISFNGMFKKSWQDKFNDGVAALDGNSVFIFTTEKDAQWAKACFNDRAEKIDTPIFKTYTLVASKEDLPKTEFSPSFAVYKKGDKYYIMDINSLGGLYAGRNIKDYDKSRFGQGEIRELCKGDKIVVRDKLFDEPGVILEFTPPKEYNPREAEKYMEVKNRFAEEKAISNFNKSTVSIFSRPTNKVSSAKEFTFADVGGLDTQIEELRKYVIRPINYPDVYKNVRLNKGILLYGPPRCGKTLLGKALANEAGAKYTYMNANEFISSEVGSSEKSIRSAFNGIMENPTILFIDEFDAIGMKRSSASTARYQNAVVNQLLGSMSDLEKSYVNSFVIAATNRKDLLDDALISTGRFGLHLEIPMPNEDALGSIYDIHSKNQPLDSDVLKPAFVKIMLEKKFNGSDVAEMFTVGYFNALERLGMNAKMDAKIFNFKDLSNIKVSAKDLLGAIDKISSQKAVLQHI